MVYFDEWTNKVLSKYKPTALQAMDPHHYRAKRKLNPQFYLFISLFVRHWYFSKFSSINGRKEISMLPVIIIYKICQLINSRQ